MINERIKTKNIRNEMKQLITPFLEKLKEKEEILGIVVLGGMSENNRKHLDVYSDIDISIFIESKDKIPNYIPNYEFYLFDKNKRKVEINVHEMIMSIESTIEWDEGKKEAYKHAEYYYEKDSRVRKLINSKITFDEEYRKNRLALIIGQYKWYVEINPLRAIKRGFYVNAIELLNKGIDMFYEAIFLYNREYQPHHKWKFELSCDLEWTPKNYRKKMEKALLTTEITKKGILTKRKNIKKLYDELIKKLNEEFDEGIDYYKYACYNSYTDRQAVEYTFADMLWNKFENSLTPEEKIELYSFINENLIGTEQEILDFNISKINSVNKNIYTKIINILNKGDEKHG